MCEVLLFVRATFLFFYFFTSASALSLSLSSPEGESYPLTRSERDHLTKIDTCESPCSFSFPWPSSLSLSAHTSAFFFFPFFQYRQHIQQFGSCQFSGFHFPHDLSSQTLFFFFSLFLFPFNSFLFQPLSETIVEIALTGDCLDPVFLLLLH